MHISGLLLFLTFIIGSQACPHCPHPIEEKHSKDCEACTECNYPNDGTKRSMDMWCKNPVCGYWEMPTGANCPITYHGLCGLTKCAKGKVESEGMCINDPTNSMECCKDKCPHKNEILNTAHCQNWVCGQDGRTYKGICALDECGKTKIQCDGPCPCDESEPESEPESSGEVDITTTPTMKPPMTTMVPSSEETMEIDETNMYCGCNFKDFMGWDPVCGYNGQFYNNSCHANCFGIHHACKAKEPKDCPCKEETMESVEEPKKPCLITYEWAPVCGADGQFYANPSSASCDKTKVACAASEPKDCPCKEEPSSTTFIYHKN